MDVEAILLKAQELMKLYGPKALAALAILVIGWIVVKIVVGIVRRGMVKAKVDPTLIEFCRNMLFMLLMTLVVVSAINRLGVETTSFTAVLAAAGFAVGFALQGSLGNFAAGVMLIIFRPFKIGDYIEAAGVSGSVEGIQVFATTLKTPDNKIVVVPNSSITGGNITNYSAEEKRRVDLVFGIGYGDVLKKAKSILANALAKEDRVLDDPAPTIAVSISLYVRGSRPTTTGMCTSP